MLKGLCSTRQEAKEVIDKGHALVDGVPITKQSKDVNEGTALEVLSTRRYVSRGGEKLAGAFNFIFGDEEKVYDFLQGKTALDIGASTGGFTDFLLQHGVSFVTAVDVGSGQLHEHVKMNTQVTSFENTDIRDFSTDEKYDVIVADLSFIPLKNVIEKTISFGKKGAYFFLLIKPQFEVGKGNTKKGVVKDPHLVSETLSAYESLLLEYRVKNLQITKCVISGGDGNQEYFASFSL